MVKTYLELVSPGEADLLEAISLVEYGEMFGVEIEQGEGQWIETEISPAMRDLLLYIRSGVQHIDVLTVHCGQPTQAETDSIIFGFRCRKRIKFPIRDNCAGKRDE
jgi:hypothetical protein